MQFIQLLTNPYREYSTADYVTTANIRIVSNKPNYLIDLKIQNGSNVYYHKDTGLYKIAMWSGGIYLPPDTECVRQNGSYVIKL